MLNSFFIKKLNLIQLNLKIVNIKSIILINKGMWPLNNLNIKKFISKFVRSIQIFIIELNSIGINKNIVLYLVSNYSFSIPFRILAIEMFRIKTFSFTIPWINQIKNIFWLSSDKFWLFLFKNSNFKNINLKMNMKLINKNIQKEDCIIIKSFIISNIKDLIIQMQFYFLLDPLIDLQLSPNIYSYRKGRNALNSIAFLKSSLIWSDLSKYYLIVFNILNCYNNISYTYVLNKFPFPKKYIILLKRWVYAFFINSKGIKFKSYKGIFYISFISVLIINYIMNKALYRIFNNRGGFLLSITQNYNLNGLPVNSYYCYLRFYLLYENNLILKVLAKSEINKCVYLFYERLRFLGIIVNIEKIKYYRVSNLINFNWLGYKFLVIPLIDFKKKNTIKNWNVYFKKYKINTYSIVYTFISHFNYKKIKIILKHIIKRLNEVNLLFIIKKINIFIKDISWYYYFGFNFYKFSFILYFIDRLFLRFLIKKYYFRGLKKKGWVISYFFKSNISPFGLKWHLHCLNFIFSGRWFKQFLWLDSIYYSYRIWPLISMLSPSYLKNKSWYNVQDYFEFYLKKRYFYGWYRQLDFSLFLFIKQSGFCLYCDENMWIYRENLKIYYINFKFIIEKNKFNNNKLQKWINYCLLQCAYIV